MSETAAPATIYLLAPTNHLHAILAPGTVIVGTPGPGAGVTIDYCGNPYGAVNLHEFRERAVNAAGRHFTRYPTVARAFIADPAELTPIGSVGRDYDVEITDLEAANAIQAAYRTAFPNAPQSALTPPPFRPPRR